MIFKRRKVRIETERLTLRPPVHADFRSWSSLRLTSQEFLTPWEPAWANDHLTRKSFTNRVYWAQRSVSGGTALPLFLVRREDDALVGAITLDNIRRGPAQAGTLGYWTGAHFARQGYMREAIGAVVHQAFARLDCEVIQIVRSDLMRHEDTDAVNLVKASLEADGVKILTQTKAVRCFQKDDKQFLAIRLSNGEEEMVTEL